MKINIKSLQDIDPSKNRFKNNHKQISRSKNVISHNLGKVDKSFFEGLDLDVYVVVPAYNENKTIKNVLKGLEAKNLPIILVDDGSDDDTYRIVKSFFDKSYPKGYIYRHVLNRGLGASLKTGIEAALRKNPDIIVTFDADGQHDPEDVIKVCTPIMNGEADIVIGKRDFNDMPVTKKLGNYIMNSITWIFYGIHVHDSQSGLRAFNRKAGESLNTKSRGYGISSEIIREIKRNNLKLQEVPIKTIYTEYSLSKGTNTQVGLKILFKMIMDIFR